MRYILTSGPQLSKEQLNTVLKQIEQIYPEGSEVTMTLAEVFRNEGIEEGETRALIKIAIRLLMKKFGIMPAEYREKITHLDSTALEILIEEISSYESIEDIRKFFQPSNGL